MADGRHTDKPIGAEPTRLRRRTDVEARWDREISEALAQERREREAEASASAKAEEHRIRKAHRTVILRDLKNISAEIYYIGQDTADRALQQRALEIGYLWHLIAGDYEEAPTREGHIEFRQGAIHAIHGGPRRIDNTFTTPTASHQQQAAQPPRKRTKTGSRDGDPPKDPGGHGSTGRSSRRG